MTPALQFDPALLLAAQGVRVAFFDVDGVLTDGGLYLSAEGEALKRFNILDGLGLKLLQQAGITPVVITGRDSPALRARLAALGITRVHYGTEDKAPAAEQTLAALSLGWHEAAAIGDALARPAGAAALRVRGRAGQRPRGGPRRGALRDGGRRRRRRGARVLRPAAGGQRALCRPAGALRVRAALRPAGLAGRLRTAWDRAALYLPAVIMGMMALGTYWLARNTPTFQAPAAQRPLTHEPDYFMRRFSLRTFDAGGRLKSEIFGTEGRHYPDTDTLEIDQPRIRFFNEQGELTTATARRGISNGDGTEVQLVGDAVVTREAGTGPGGSPQPRMQVRGEFLHAFLDTERVTSPKPVVLVRGSDQFTADSLDYDNLDRVMELRGRVRGTLQPGGAAAGGDAR
ncbi:Candidate 3-deoxy-D-manno-octulosonate 8-phosphate phosphatase [Ramlibacter tataouinensis TTB310]|uniref:Candidate 3-deoxy-D-manno-octulosonate 8-phosphate phosphatase n=1 Tax=Ramlibacter tataouinensis (strain ATCC BAA-407 / DSM 14655 / LMG 21543 / TTB310) TaxID=365046 RepID=F5Y351_RAMTT|nr:Candidate 3-deoxy-D-manno-octulosonate 8-phosphate phosphatase [Ramlibacter tataouinensis TTB310]